MRIALSILLVIACLFCGYGFYRMNQRDVFNAVCFTIGILGVMLSFLRNTAKKRDKTD